MEEKNTDYSNKPVLKYKPRNTNLNSVGEEGFENLLKTKNLEESIALHCRMFLSKDPSL